MLGLIVGVLAVSLGAKAFTPKGLPLTKKRNLTGTAAKTVGAACILLGLWFIADGAYGTTRLMNLMSGQGR